MQTAEAQKYLAPNNSAIQRTQYAYKNQSSMSIRKKNFPIIAKQKNGF